MNEISKQIGLINLNISRLAPSGVGVGAFVPAHQILEKCGGLLERYPIPDEFKSQTLCQYQRFKLIKIIHHARKSTEKLPNGA